MASDPPLDTLVVCPNCQALNPARALICPSCGVNLGEFEAALPRIRQLQAEYTAAHRAQLADDTSALVVSETASGRRRLKTQLRLTLIAATLLAVLLTLGLAWYVRWQAQRRAELAASYKAALACLDAEDFLCARDGFIKLLEAQPDYRDALERLRLARYGLARQYAQAGQWPAAVDELDQVLKEDPTDPRALNLLQETYNRWLADALGRGDIVTVTKVMLQREARFPNKQQR